MRSSSPTKVSPEIRELGLERHVLDLEVDGLTIVPPEVHGVPMARFDRMIDLILERAQAMTGSPFSLDRGPHLDLEFPEGALGLAGLSRDASPPKLTQFLIQQLARIDRVFRDLAVNPVAVALMKHLLGRRATRFSSHNAFVKWQGEFGYGDSLGLHADQTAIPQPWGRRALTSNANWCLTEYSKEAGALAYVPGSHRNGTAPVQPQAARAAVAAEAPRGSLIVFHGATWHGAFPRLIPGMRLMVANYYRHAMITSQEDIQGTFPRELADDCDDPALFRELAGFADVFPYAKQSEIVPKVTGAVADR